VSSSTAPTQGLSTQKTFVSPAASANKPPNPARTAPKTKVSAKRRQVINAPSSTQSSGNGLFKPLTPAQRKMLETEYYVNKNFYGRDKLYAALKRKHGDPALRTTKDGSTAAEIADMRNHPMFASTLLPPSLDDSAASLAYTMPCQVDGKGPFVEDLRVELSATGVLTLHVSPLDKRSIDLSDSNAVVTLPKVSKRPFCLQVTQSKLNQCVLDACTGLQFEKWRYRRSVGLRRSRAK
jgi:hypothetical protein